MSGYVVFLHGGRIDLPQLRGKIPYTPLPANSRDNENIFQNINIAPQHKGLPPPPKHNAPKVKEL